MHLSIKNLYKTFDDFVALDRITLDVGPRDFVCLLGPSGCGKTTLLRIIAGLLPFDGGMLTLGEKDLATLPAKERGFGIVFQSYSLFPNMTVAENVGYGLRVRKEPAARIAARVAELLELIKLPHLAERYPHQLSGGQQQRVAIARALAVDPSLLLLDEPLSALDARVRVAMRSEIRQVQRRLGIPTIMVTHDQEEALTLADKVVCMNHGRIEQIGTPQEIYARPRTRFVADFVGISNLLPADWVRDVLPELAGQCPEGDTKARELCLRPEDIKVTADGAGEGRVTEVNFLGNLTRLNVQWKGRELVAEYNGFGAPEVGESVSLSVTPSAGAWVRA
ncbi:ABC transporter ATP-binding protein [Telmatospirillum sp. J64-1]|uniref:ABC transporter ATP-binding protein n=1 Tax=Telmatospirillum sp. J64-1 TaxID=2502183 RepID=UPI00115F4E71|nr:ATP-binding cassette domain-containing protein [Telmatospirillum sp. J64-1]